MGRSTFKSMLCLLVALAFLGVGCGSYVYVSAQKDLDYQFKNQETIFVFIPDEVSVKQKNLYTILSRELKRAGYNIVESSDEARLMIDLSVRKETVDKPAYFSPYAFGFYDRFYSDFFWPRYPFNRYYAHRYYISEDRSIVSIQLYDAQQFKAGKRIPLWEGFVSGDEMDLQRNGPESFLRPLLLKIGESFQGRVPLSKD